MLRSASKDFKVIARNKQCEGMYPTKSIASLCTAMQDTALSCFPTAEINTVARDVPMDKSNISAGYGGTQFECEISDPGISLDEFNDRLGDLTGLLRAKGFVI